MNSLFEGWQGVAVIISIIGTSFFICLVYNFCRNYVQEDEE